MFRTFLFSVAAVFILVTNAAADTFPQSTDDWGVGGYSGPTMHNYCMFPELEEKHVALQSVIAVQREIRFQLQENGDEVAAEELWLQIEAAIEYSRRLNQYLIYLGGDCLRI